MGSPLLSDEHDPVTTDPKGEALFLSQAIHTIVKVANLRTTQYAGSWQGHVHLPSYISGYFDGEGCFSVAIAPRDKLRVGWEVRPSVSVSQNGDRSEVIHSIREYFACGSIREDPGDKTLKWETRSLGDIVDRVLAHFRMYPLQSGKKRDVALLDAITRRMIGGQHLRRHGLSEIIELVRDMNPSGKRRYDPDRILKDLEQDEGIVCAPGNGGRT